METLADLYVDYAGWALLAVFLAASAWLVASAGDRLPSTWWVGATVGGLAMIALTTMIALALRGLAPNGTVPLEGWLAVAVAGALGFIAAMDVQLAWGAIGGRRPGAGAVVVGAVAGPAIVVAGYLLLGRSMEWIRLL